MGSRVWNPSKTEHFSTCAVSQVSAALISGCFHRRDAKDAKSFFVFFAVERTAKKKERFS